MYRKVVFSSVVVVLVSALSGCFEDVKEPTCSDLRSNDIETLKKQEGKFPDLMRNLREKCPNQGTGGFQPSTATKGLIR
ncbi:MULTISPECIES: hypothetical protein [unclassified Pseudomonas]|uniref:hypothetical protein n=1 Tax=unclassified Pseudomonas TaxID=196821 RepID=UPI00117A9729|nr:MULTISPECIES: hypothetical protein [unclassified Pseudomonas]